MNKILAVLAACTVTHAFAQHHAHPQAEAHSPPTSAYAGEESREIKALSPQEQRAWLEGQGAGLAKAAELNQYPGPMHVLEHAVDLRLTPAQAKQTRGLMERHQAEVRRLGAELVAAERRLDDLFRLKQATAVEVNVQTQQIGRLQAQIRACHLNTHLEQTSYLDAGQIAAYSRFRGYK